MLDMFAKTGHAAGLELWKHTLTKALGDEATASAQPAFVLWDFSTLNAITAEAVPPKGAKPACAGFGRLATLKVSWVG